MSKSRFWSLMVAALILLRGIIVRGWEEGSTIAMALAVILMMIWSNEFWAKYILPFGWLESKARDFKKAEYSAPAIAFVGWVLLLLILYMTYFHME
ncbi:MAG: hypothetical protein OQK73_01635 [Gammaproteobacteria bacterium]|nr:hypothetical protein [Gammaproteobacteria bacterium]